MTRAPFDPYTEPDLLPVDAIGAAFSAGGVE
jgi:hypothetical protein